MDKNALKKVDVLAYFKQRCELDRSINLHYAKVRKYASTLMTNPVTQRKRQTLWTKMLLILYRFLSPLKDRSIYLHYAKVRQYADA